MRKTLIVDLNVQLNGHKFGYIQNLIWFLDEQKTLDEEYYFLVNELPEKFQLKSDSKIKLEYINAQSIDGNLMQVAKNQWRIIEDFAKNHRISSVILLEFDIYQLEIFKRRLEFEVSGIWFRPYMRIVKDKLKSNLEIIQKKTLLKLALRNKKLRQIFILNDEWMVGEMNKLKEVFYYLPDPVFDYKPENINIREKYDIDENRKIALIFGFIDGRKNVFNSIEALEKLNELDQKSLTLLMIGRFDSAAKSEIINRVNEAIKNHPNLQIIMDDNFVQNGFMETLFSQASIILRMNVNFFGSSGVIGHAAKYNKPLLVSNFGLVAELVEQYKLGWTVDPSDSNKIAEKLTEYLEGKIETSIDGQSYYMQHSRDAFAKALLNLT